MEQSLLFQGVNLMLYGMGCVFFFLTLLVCITYLMSKTVNNLPNWLASKESSLMVTAKNATSENVMTKQQKHAIELAIATHRKTNSS